MQIFFKGIHQLILSVNPDLNITAEWFIKNDDYLFN